MGCCGARQEQSMLGPILSPEPTEKLDVILINRMSDVFFGVSLHQFKASSALVYVPLVLSLRVINHHDSLAHTDIGKTTE